MDNLKLFKGQLIRNYKSKQTIDAYLRDIIQFIDFMKDKQLEDVDFEDIESYKLYMLNIRKLQAKSVNRKLVSINQYFTFCQIAVPVRQVKIHTQNFLDEIFDNDEVSKIIEETEVHSDLRAKALIMTLKMTGMRISEALQLCADDINKDTVTIIGKGQKRRYVFIPKKLQQILQEYSKTRINKSDKLFTGQKGAINRHTAHTIIKRYGFLAGVDFKKNHCHNYRHMFVKNMLDKNISIEITAEIVGHSDVNITRIYAKRTKKELLNIINNLD